MSCFSVSNGVVEDRAAWIEPSWRKFLNHEHHDFPRHVSCCFNISWKFCFDTKQFEMNHNWRQKCFLACSLNRWKDVHTLAWLSDFPVYTTHASDIWEQLWNLLNKWNCFCALFFEECKFLPAEISEKSCCLISLVSWWAAETRRISATSDWGKIVGGGGGLVPPFGCKKGLIISLCDVHLSGCLSVHSWNPVPPNVISGQLTQFVDGFFFWFVFVQFFLIQNFFSPQKKKKKREKKNPKYFHFLKHFWMFHAILSAQHVFSPNFFFFFFLMSCGWSMARHNAAKHSGFRILIFNLKFQNVDAT